MDYTLEPITVTEFNNSVKIKFNNILSGFDSFLNFTLTEKNNETCDRKFIKFIESVFNENNNECYIDLYLNNLSKSDKENLMNLLCNADKNILEDLLKLNHNNPYYKLTSSSLIPFLVRLNTKELFFVTFYFTKNPITIWGNYNLSFPCFFDDRNSYNHYLNLAEKINIATQL